MFTFTLAQLNFIIGDLSGNVTRMADAARKAATDGAQAIVFTELSLTGHPSGDLLDESGFLARVDAALMKLCDASRVTPNLYWVVGAPTRHRPGKVLQNSLLVLKNGQIALQYAKQLLPPCSVFAGRRYFEPGPDSAACLEIGGTRVGFLIGEDAWNDEGKEGTHNPLDRLAAENPDLVIVIGASPSYTNMREERHTRILAASRGHGFPMVYANQVGGHDQLVFDGASFAATPDGVVFEAARFEEAVTTLRLQDGAFLGADGRSLAPVPTVGLPLMAFYRRQIVLGLTDFTRRCGFSKVVVGASGGLDSALVLALAAEALGSENVIAITLPSRISSLSSVNDSAALCRSLGIKLFEHPIRNLVATFEQGFNAAFSEPLRGLALENVQARVRGTVLMEYCNQFGALLLTTGNKSEVSVGYCTLYGDTNGSLAPIGDLYKTEVFALSRYLNEAAERELIPEAIINKEPSAELAPGQKDSDSLPPYPVLDMILKVLTEGKRLRAEERDEVKAAWDGLAGTKDGEALITRVRQMIWKSEFKRRQAAPVLYMRPQSFGSVRQFPIAAKYEQLVSAIPAFYGGNE
ncbi:MAG: NAD+ synthase [Betaproteobacteria bacterium]|nr:NAD+ synthase [Betaproteobacteria bacterium]